MFSIMIRWIKRAFAASVMVLWVFSIIILVLSTVIRDNLSTVALVTEGTGIGNFYLKSFFPVIFPILITVACFLFVIGCVGCCGVFTNSQPLLGWFFFTLLVTFCVELSAGVWRIIEYDLSYNETDVIQLRRNIDVYTGGENTPAWFADAWMEIHSKFNCCGVDSYKDWIGKSLEVLMTCSSSEYPNPVMILGTPGCGYDILAYLSSSQYMNAMPYVTGILGLVQVLAMILTLKIWLVYCLEAKEKPMTFDHTKAPVQCRPDEGQFYQIEMENKHGTSCCITPVMSYKDTRVCEYPSLLETTPRSNRITSSDPNGSGDVINLSTLHATNRSSTSSQKIRQNGSQKPRLGHNSTATVDVQSLPRRTGSHLKYIRQNSTKPNEICTCSLGRRNEKIPVVKPGASTISSQNSRQNRNTTTQLKSDGARHRNGQLAKSTSRVLLVKENNGSISNSILSSSFKSSSSQLVTVSVESNSHKKSKQESDDVKLQRTLSSNNSGIIYVDENTTLLSSTAEHKQISTYENIDRDFESESNKLRNSSN